ATLKQKAEAREALQRSVRGEGLDDGFRLTFKPAEPVRPTDRQIADYLKEHGVEKTLELVRSRTDRPTGRLAAAAAILLKDGEATAALPALRFAIKDEPTDAAYQVWLGQALSLTGDREGARAAYRKAAELLAGDKADERSREAYKYLIDKGLKELGPAEPPPKDRSGSRSPS